MSHPPRRRRSWLFGLCLAGLASAFSLAPAQQPGRNPNEKLIEPELTAYDKEDVWTLHFRFRPPRIITADVPGRGKKIVWYMWYQVINHTGEPRTFIPEFELVTLDKNTAHLDEVMPAVQDVIRQIEDPLGRMHIKNSVTISKDAIPVTKPESSERAVTGVAIWTDVYDKARDTNTFSVFVGGLSNGFLKDDNNRTRRKTLQLNFKRLSDERTQDSSYIRWVDDPKWIYRSAFDNAEPPAKNGKDKKEPLELKIPAPKG